MGTPEGEVTRLLHAWGGGDRSVEDRLFELVLPDLRKLAERMMRRERPDHSLQPTALLNEASEATFAEWLKGIPEAKHVCLVGHAPTLAERVRRLLGVEAPETFKMPKGGLACLETENRRTAALKFFITPKVLGVRED